MDVFYNFEVKQPYLHTFCSLFFNLTTHSFLILLRKIIKEDDLSNIIFTLLNIIRDQCAYKINCFQNALFLKRDIFFFFMTNLSITTYMIKSQNKYFVLEFTFKKITKRKYYNTQYNEYNGIKIFLSLIKLEKNILMRGEIHFLINGIFYVKYQLLQMYSFSFQSIPCNTVRFIQYNTIFTTDLQLYM